MPKMLDFLVEEGYTVTGRKKFTIYEAKHHEGITEVVQFIRSHCQLINLMIVNTDGIQSEYAMNT